MSLMNRLGNAKNAAQGAAKKVLCVCSAGLLRSPTTAVVLSQEPYNYNTRAAGCVEEFALVPVDDVLLLWADEIVCMETRHEKALRAMGCTKKIIVLGIPDNFEYRDPYLMKLIAERYASSTGNAK